MACNPCLLCTFAYHHLRNPAYGITCLQSIGRIGKDIHTGRGIHQAPHREPEGVQTDTGRDLHQQGDGRNEGANRAAALRHLEGGPRLRSLPRTTAPGPETRTDGRRTEAQSRNGPAVHAARLQPLPGGNHRLVLPVGDEKPGTRTGTDTEPEHRTEQRGGAGRSRGQPDRETDAGRTGDGLAAGLHQRTHRGRQTLERVGRNQGLRTEHLRRKLPGEGGHAEGMPEGAETDEALQGGVERTGNGSAGTDEGVQ